MTVIYLAIGIISLIMVFAQAQLFEIKEILKEIRDSRS